MYRLLVGSLDKKTKTEDNEFSCVIYTGFVIKNGRPFFEIFLFLNIISFGVMKRDEKK